MTTSRLRALTLVLVAGLATGTACIFRGPSGMRRELSRAAGVELDRQMAFTIGRTGILLARMVTDGDKVPLRGVHKVQVGIYEVKGLRPGFGEQLTLEPPHLPGWENVVRIREEDESVFIMLREEKGKVRGLLVVVAEEDEWVIVRVRGNLQRVLEKTMEMAFEKADRPELYEPALADYRQRNEGDKVAAVTKTR